MDHSDHIALLRRGIPELGGVWADLGAGNGAFTLALADLLGPGCEIHAIDRDRSALSKNVEAVSRRFPNVEVHSGVADFTRPLRLPTLDGIVMANSLHFQADQGAVVRQLRLCLRAGGRMLVVEYNIDQGNFAVPNPVPFSRWEQLAEAAGFQHTERLATRPSRFLREIYSAASW